MNASKHYTTYVLTISGQGFEPVELCLADDQLPTALLAIGGLYGSICGGEVLVAVGDELESHDVPEWLCPSSGEVDFEAGQELFTPSMTTRYIARDEVRDSIRRCAFPNKASVVIAAIEEKFPEKVWGDELPRAALWAFIFDRHRQSFR